MMLNLMEQFPLGEYGFHSARALHVMIEAKKLAYADMLRYVADSAFSTAAGRRRCSTRRTRKRARGGIDPAQRRARRASRRCSTA